jgi:hypothetical protein
LLRFADWAAAINASVQAKLLGAFLLGACLLVGMGALSHAIVGRMSGNVRDLGGLHEKIDRSRQMEYLITAQSHFRAMALLTQDESNKAKIRASKSAFLSHLSALESASSGARAGLPVDTVKIDRSFVSGLGQDPNDGAIARGVIALAKTLNLSVTGEGIETPEQLSQLTSLGCDFGQGYYLARPLEPEVLATQLATQVRADRGLASGDEQAA